MVIRFSNGEVDTFVFQCFQRCTRLGPSVLMLSFLGAPPLLSPSSSFSPSLSPPFLDPVTLPWTACSWLVRAARPRAPPCLTFDFARTLAGGQQRLATAEEEEEEDVPNGLAAISKVPAAGWGPILAYMAFCEVSQDQSPGTPAAAGDFGFKVLTASDPEEKTKKLSAELANGRLEVPMSYLEDMIDTSVQWGNLSPADSVCMSYKCTRNWSVARTYRNKLMHILNGNQFKLLTLMYLLLWLGTFDADCTLSIINFLGCYVLHFWVLWTSVGSKFVMPGPCRKVKGVRFGHARRRSRTSRYSGLLLLV